MDIQPPGLGNLEAVRRMRLQPVLCQVPIIILTAVATADVPEMSPEGGAIAYLNQPVVLDELGQVIKSLLSHPGRIPAETDVKTS